MEKTVIELFAGVGGFRVGLNNVRGFDKNGKAIEERDWKFVWANQWEPSTTMQPAYDCYKIRFGEECLNVNIQEVNKKEIPDHTLLVGGFPCQDYSVARGLSGEKGIHGKKGDLFWEIAEILTKKKPPFVLLENVDRLLKSPSTQRGRDFGIMLRTFADKGYNVEWRVINAAEYGARQKRRRIFIFAWKKGTNYNKKIRRTVASKILLEKGLFAKTFPVRVSEDGTTREVDISKNSFADTVEMTERFKFDFENTGCMMNGKVHTTKMDPIEEQFESLGSILQRNVDKSFYLSEKQDEQFEFLKGAKQIKRKKPNGEYYLYSEGKCASPII